MAEQSNLKVTARPRPILKRTKPSIQQQQPLATTENDIIYDEKLILLSNKLKILTNEHKHKLNLHINHHHQLHQNQVNKITVVAPKVPPPPTPAPSPSPSIAKSKLHRFIYNCEINKEIIQMISKSTNDFFSRIEDEFNIKMNNSNVGGESNKLITEYKNEFIPKLKEFLTGSNANEIKYNNNNNRNSILNLKRNNSRINKSYIMNFMHKYYFTLSEPELSINSQALNEYTSKYDGNNNDVQQQQQQHHSKYTKPSKVNKRNANIRNNKQLSTRVSAMRHSHSIDIASETSTLCGSLPNEYDLSLSSKFEQLSALKKNEQRKYSSLIQAKKETKKFVRFADSLGLDLVSVKFIKETTTTASAYNFPTSIEASSTAIDSEIKPPTLTKTNPKQYLVLIPCFTLAKYFYNENDNECKLIDYLFDNENKIIKFLIRVKNLSNAKKRVFVRITFNNWKTYSDINGIDTSASSLSKKKKDYASDNATSIICNSKININNNNEFNNFNCVLSINDYLNNDNDCVFKIEFAICFKTMANNNDNDVNEHWDNNNNNNYAFQCFNPKN